MYPGIRPELIACAHVRRSRAQRHARERGFCAFFRRNRAIGPSCAWQSAPALKKRKTNDFYERGIRIRCGKLRDVHSAFRTTRARYLRTSSQNN
jgi:hypothetical protein